MSLHRLTLALLSCVVAACSGVPERPPAPVFDDDARFSAETRGDTGEPTVTPGTLPGDWWQRAVDQVHWSPMIRVLPGNPRLREADAAIEAARERLTQAEGSRGPEIGVAADADTRRNDLASSNSRSLAVNATLPIDVRGLLTTRRDAAAAALQAALADREQLFDDLARDYLLALLDGSEAHRRLALLDRQLEVAGTLLRLIELRFTQGLTSSVDVLQQRDQVAALQQQLPLTRLAVVSAGNRLRFAAGVTPEKPLPGQSRELLEVATGYPPLAPVDLLQRRADLRAGAARLAAADADFAAALADRLPEIGLSAGFLARVLSSDYSRLVSATLDAAFTLFDGGRKRAVAGERRAQLAAAGERYVEAWLEAVIELDNLLHEERSLVERIALSEARLANADTLLTAATRRYERGVSDYLPVLEALRGLQQQERDLLALRAELARVRIRLHHGFGRPAGGAGA